MLDFLNKSIKKDIRYMNIAEAYLNIKLENLNTANNLKKEYGETEHKIALDELDLSKLKMLYNQIHKSKKNSYDKNNSFILSLSILLISKILNVNTISILNDLGIN